MGWIIPGVIIVLIILQGWTVIPRAYYLFRPGSRKFYFDDNPQVPIRETSREALGPVTERLAALGFTQLGLLIEKPPLWARGSRELSLASTEAKTIVSLGMRGLRPAYFFYTPFEEGQVLITAYNSFKNFKSEDFIITVVDTADLDEMMNIHKRKIEEFQQKGFRPFQTFDRDSVIRATYFYYASRRARRQLLIGGLASLGYMVLLVVILALLLAGLF
jgi:hypothetical protein